MLQRDEETVRLQGDLGDSLDKIEGLRETVNDAAAAKGYDESQDVVEDLRREAEGARRDAASAEERIARLESELEASRGEIDGLRRDAGPSDSAAPAVVPAAVPSSDGAAPTAAGDAGGPAANDRNTIPSWSRR